LNEKYGFIINSLQKDYEIVSWNEQGEITRIKGILTIAFFISVCSHKDNSKQLYLIIKIPYMVNMSVQYITDDIVIKNELTEDEEIELLRRAIIGGYSNLEWKYYQPHHERIFKKYKQNIEKVKELELKVNKLETENKILKEKIEELMKKYDELLLNSTNTSVENKKLSKEILRLKIISGEVKSGWRQDQDMVERDNPETGELEFYKCPINFIHSAVQNKTYLDKRRLEVRFYHDVGETHDRTWFEMPTDAYLWLCGELPEQQKEKTKYHSNLKIDTKEQMKNYLENCKIVYHEKKIDYRSLAHLDIVTDYILCNKGKKFETKDFRRETDIHSSTTTAKYLTIFESCKILYKHQTGLWEVII